MKTIPMEKKCKKAKWLSEEALQTAVKRREAKSKGENERYKHLNAEFQRIARRDKKAFFNDQGKEIEENTRSFRYDLNQIPYDYTVEVRNRFKGLDLIDRVPEELWMEFHNIVQKAVIKTIPKKKNCNMAKWLPEEAFHFSYFLNYL